MTVAAPPGVVIFDLDGTLVDSVGSVAAAMTRALADRGFDIAVADVVPLIGAPMEILVEEITGWSPEVSREVNEQYARLYYDEYIEHTEPMPGAEALLDRLTASGVPLTVLTNKVERGGRRMLEVMGWEDRFELLVGRDTLANAKPAPDGALHIVERFGVGPAAGAMVGDTEFDVTCGRDAALGYVVGVLGGRTEVQLRTAGATHVARTLDEVGDFLLGGRDRRD